MSYEELMHLSSDALYGITRGDYDEQTKRDAHHIIYRRMGY